MLLLALLVVVGVYTSQANQILVVSSVAVISIAIVVASCKLNTIAGLSKMVKEDVAAKADPPPTYDDVLHSEAPPPSYYTVVSEAAGGSGSDSSPAGPVVTLGKEGREGLPENNQPSKQTSSSGNKRNPSLRRWLGRPGILHSVMFRASRRPSDTTSPAPPVKAPEGKGVKLRRSSSTPSLAGLSPPVPLARYPSTPSLCDHCGCF